jgi:hypothetical protein
MSTENAALTEEATLDQQIIDESNKTEAVELTESAPVAEEAPKEDGFQKRINKVTADKYEQQRRADDLQRQLDEVKATPKKESTTPKLEDFDYDEELFNAASIKHQVAQAVQTEKQALQTEAQQVTAAETQRVFNESIVAMNKTDFADVASAVPQLPAGVADALVQSENGAELIYHLGTHLDMADRLANMSPQMAIMELGRISANMNTKPEIKTSAAPNPIEPITSGGGSLGKDMGEMSMEEIYNSVG